MDAQPLTIRCPGCRRAPDCRRIIRATHVLRGIVAAERLHREGAELVELASIPALDRTVVFTGISGRSPVRGKPHIQMAIGGPEGAFEVVLACPDRRRCQQEFRARLDTIAIALAVAAIRGEYQIVARSDGPADLDAVGVHYSCSYRSLVDDDPVDHRGEDGALTVEGQRFP